MTKILCDEKIISDFKNFDFDGKATQILQEYQPEVLKTAKPLDIDELVNAFELYCVEVIITKSGTILGFITFIDQNIPILDDNMENSAISAIEGTIIIDKRLKDIPTRYRFTKAHEFSHWILHGKYYLPLGESCTFRNLGCSYIAYRREARGRKNPVEARTLHDWIEWQSDNMAAALLMPAVTFIPKAKEILGEYGLEQGQLIYGDANAYEAIIRLANIYNVSRRSVNIRLNSYGFYAS